MFGERGSRSSRLKIAYWFPNASLEACKYIVQHKLPKFVIKWRYAIANCFELNIY